MKLTSDDLKNLSDFLNDVAQVTRQGGVRLAPHGPADIEIGGNVITIAWDDQTESYVVVDRIGS